MLVTIIAHFIVVLHHVLISKSKLLYYTSRWEQIRVEFQDFERISPPTQHCSVLIREKSSLSELPRTQITQNFRNSKGSVQN